MTSYLGSVVASIFYRALELQPAVDLSEAKQQVTAILRESDFGQLNERQISGLVQQAGDHFARRGVINPLWLRHHGLRAHFFLANARPGWLDHLLTGGGADRGVSQYILYGDYDSLIILYGSSDEAARQQEVIDNDIYVDTLAFSARSVQLVYRQQVREVTANGLRADPELVNQIALDYDNISYVKARQELISDGVLLGPVWFSKAQKMDRLIAFVGIALRGRHPVEPKQVLQALQSSHTAGRALVHLFETDLGHPYQFFAKLVCKDQEELDGATDDIGRLTFGSVRTEGTTMVVAQGFDSLPTYRSGVRELLGELPSLADVESTAREMVKELGPDASRRFNELEASLKLAILSGLARIKEQLERARLEDPWRTRLYEAARQFGSGALDGAGPGLDGAVTATTNTVEEAAKKSVRHLAEAVFGDDSAEAQKALRLANKKYHKLTLGNIVQAYGAAARDPRYKAYQEIISEESIKLLETFTEQRNQWLHGANTDLGRTRRIHSAADVLIRAIELIEWFDSGVMRTVSSGKTVPPHTEADHVPVKIAKQRADRRLGFFVSHSSKDKAFARRISEGLRALGLDVFFDDWAIGPSDSIVDKIDNALAEHDTLAILLSPNSVTSKWVRRELNAALMAQLNGYDVRVLPLLIMECEVPSVLSDIRYIDFTGSFEDGFIELIQYIKRRRDGGGSADRSTAE